MPIIIGRKFPAIDDRNVSSKWAHQNANKGYIPSAHHTSLVFDYQAAISSVASVTEAGALLNLLKQDKETYEML